MPILRNFDEAREALKAYYHNPVTHTYTLERMWTLVKFLGNPQDKLKVIHIAGTSGKSSTAYYSSMLLHASGANVGLSVSPHVFEMNERVQINTVPLAEQDFCESLGKFIDLIRTAPVKPSYFELMVAFAYYEFARREVDNAVIEVGLGGLIDGTNVVSREDKVCIITDIGLDHTNVLGKTLREIATQKAGIILPQNHVFTYKQADEISNVIRETCNQKSAELHELDSPSLPLETNAKLPLFQQRNLYLASQAINFVLKRDNKTVLTEVQVSQVAANQIPGRMQTYNIGDKTLVLDGAHNGQKMEALVASMRDKFPGTQPAALVSFVNGRDERWMHALDVLAPYVSSMAVTTFSQESDEMPKKGMPVEVVAVYLKNKGIKFDIEQDIEKAVQNLLDRPEKLLLVTGSLYPIGQIEHLIQQYSH